MELYQVTDKREVHNLEYLADKVSNEKGIPLKDLFASYYCVIFFQTVACIYPLLRGKCEHDCAGDKGAKK